MIHDSVLLTLSILFLMGFCADALAHKIALPRVTLLIVCGLILGPKVTGLVTNGNQVWLSNIAQVTLLMVGFLLGGRITLKALRRYGPVVLTISVSVLLITCSLMLGGMLWIGVPTAAAILLASICTTTDPAAPTDVIHELRSDGPFTRILVGVIAINDALAYALFTIALSVSALFTTHEASVPPVLMTLWELVGAILIGAIMGRGLAFFSNHIRDSETLLAGTLGLLTLCGGLAVLLHTSFFLSVMVMGAVTINSALHPWKTFRIVERFLWPFLILFFLVAGANLEPDSLAHIGLFSVVYISCRIMGITTGVWIGGTLSKAPNALRHWMGPALLPQAGVALSMTFIAIQRYPEMKDLLLPIVISGVMVFELFGPIFTRIAIIRAGEHNAPGGGLRLR